MGRGYGEGIPTERLSKIFNKLETDGSGSGGLSLGLAIVKEIVDAHDGCVTIESTLGQGSRFTIVIPQ